MYIVLISLIILGSGCEKISYPKSSIGIVNNTDNDIEFYFAVGGDGGIVYPDTVLPISLDPPFQVAKARKIGYRDFGFSEKIIFEQLPSDTLSIYLFHPDTLAKYNWQEIINDYKILIRYDVSFENLSQLNWQIHYPPNELMEGVQMFPME